MAEYDVNSNNSTFFLNTACKRRVPDYVLFLKFSTTLKPLLNDIMVTTT